MSELKHVRSVLAVKNLAASGVFYCEKLGFTIDFEIDGWCFLSRGGFHLVFGQDLESAHERSLEQSAEPFIP